MVLITGYMVLIVNNMVFGYKASAVNSVNVRSLLLNGKEMIILKFQS